MTTALAHDVETTDRLLLSNWSDALLIVGGAMLVVGSFSPWMHGSVAEYTYYRNGMQLGFDQGFSIAGLLTVIFGTLATLSGAMHLARRPLPRIVAPSLVVDGLIGVG